MGGISSSARPLQLLPITVALLAALGALGLRARQAADAQAPLRPPVARPGPFQSPAVAHPALVFEAPGLSLGALAAGEVRRVAVRWCHVGRAPRRVLGVDATCGCVVAEPLPARVEPDEEGTLALEVRAPGRPGPFAVTVRVWLDPAPEARPPTLAVRGHVERRVGIRPAEVDLGPHTIGREVDRELDVRVTEGLRGAPVTARLEGLGGSVRVLPSVFAGRPGAALDLRVRVPATPGPFRGRAVVEVPGEPSVFVPVSGVAVGTGVAIGTGVAVGRRGALRR